MRSKGFFKEIFFERRWGCWVGKKKGGVVLVEVILNVNVLRKDVVWWSEVSIRV